MKVAAIPIMVGTLGTVPKNLENTLGEHTIQERIENFKTRALAKSA